MPLNGCVPGFSLFPFFPLHPSLQKLQQGKVTPPSLGIQPHATPLLLPLGIWLPRVFKLKWVVNPCYRITLDRFSVFSVILSKEETQGLCVKNAKMFTHQYLCTWALQCYVHANEYSMYKPSFAFLKINLYNWSE